MAKYLDPKADLTFKKIFGEHPELVISLLNASKAYVRQLKKSKKYHLLQPVYSLSLVNDVFENDIEDFYHYYRLVHEEHTEKVIDGLHLVFVELPKFKPHTISEKKMQVLWLRFLTEIGEDTKEVPAELIENAEVKQAIEIVEESAYTDEELAQYDKFWDAIRVEQAFVDEAEIRYGIGLKKGVKDAKLDTARKLKAMNVMTIEQIAEATGLKVKEIEVL